MSSAGATRPTTETDRIATLDVLRGFALLGILLVNVIGFALPSVEYLLPSQPQGADLIAWAFVELSAEGAMRGLFSILFGAGVVLFIGSGADRGASTYFRRNVLLLAFGLIDAYLLLWTGDILFVYGLCALLLYFVRNVRPSRLFGAALTLFVLMTLQHGVTQFGLGYSKQAYAQVQQDPANASPELHEIASGWEEFNRDFAGSDDFAAELTQRRDSYLSAWQWSAEQFNETLAFVLPFYLFWDAMAMMLLGMALFKWGVLQGQRERAFYWRWGAIGFLVGLTVNAWEVSRVVDADFAILQTFPQMQWTYHIGRLGMAFGWMCTLILLLPHIRAVADRLAAVGRLALTNYLMHSVLALFVFTGAGLGWVGMFSRAEIYIFVAVVWGLQLLLSPWWLARFYFGPVEWLWRGLTYGQFPVNRRPH